MSGKERKEKHFLQKPIYPGGIKAMRKFIAEQLKYPEEALKNKIEGEVHVRYAINHKGKVISCDIISGLGFGCDEEAARLVKLFEFEVGKNRNLRVQFFKNLTIHFRLPNPKAFGSRNTSSTINYQIKPKSKESTKNTSKPNQGYSYTIKWKS